MSITRRLQCELSPEELAAKSQELAHVTTMLHEAEGLRRRTAFSLTRQIRDLRAEANALSVVIAGGHETREVECQEELNFATGRVRVLRGDSGLVVEERDMTMEERQMELPLKEEALTHG